MKNTDAEDWESSNRSGSMQTKAKWVLLVIAAGALWEFIFAPLMRYFGFTVLTIFSRLSDGYLDLFYKETASLYFDNFSAVPTSLLVGLFVGVLGFSAFRVGKQLHRTGENFARLDRAKGWDDLLKQPAKADDDFRDGPFTDETFAKYSDLHIKPTRQRIKRMRFLFWGWIVPLSALLGAGVTVVLAHSSLQREAYSWVKRSLEIVAPYVDAEQRMMLLSEFRQIETSIEFFEFKKKLDVISSANSVKLPSGSFIGDRPVASKK